MHRFLVRSLYSIFLFLCFSLGGSWGINSSEVKSPFAPFTDSHPILTVQFAQLEDVLEKPDLLQTTREGNKQVWGDYLAGIVALYQHDTLAAASYFRNALALDSKNAGLNERAFVAFLASGDIAQAAQVARKNLFKDELLTLVLGVQSLKERNYEEAHHFFKSSENLTDAVLRAWVLVGLGESTKALEMMDRISLGEVPLHAYHKGLIADQSGATKVAFENLKVAYDANRMTLRSADAFARLLSRLKQFDAAATIYESFEGTPHWSALAQKSLTKLYRHESLPPLISTPQEGASELFYSLASFSIVQNNDLLALIYLRLALYLNPNHELALVALGGLFEQLRLYKDAIEAYKGVPDTSPFYFSARVRIAVALEAENKLDEALVTLKELMEKNPTSVEVLTAYGNIMFNRGQYPQAIEFYTKAINQLSIWSKSETWNLFYFRGIAYDRNQQWPLAEIDLNQALLIMPKELNMEQALVLNYLGYSWVERKENLEDAFTMLARAARLAPKEGAVIDSLGWAFFQLKRYPEAVFQLERAAELKPSDWSINDHLGDAYWKVNRKLEAVFQWSHARDLEPDDPKALEVIMKKIKDGLPNDERHTPSLRTRIKNFLKRIVS